MAWLCSGETMNELVNHMVRAGVLKDAVVTEAFRSVDRFVVIALRSASSSSSSSKSNKLNLRLK